MIPLLLLAYAAGLLSGLGVVGLGGYVLYRWLRRLARRAVAGF